MGTATATQVCSPWSQYTTSSCMWSLSHEQNAKQVTGDEHRQAGRYEIGNLDNRSNKKPAFDAYPQQAIQLNQRTAGQYHLSLDAYMFSPQNPKLKNNEFNNFKTAVVVCFHQP